MTARRTWPFPARLLRPAAAGKTAARISALTRNTAVQGIDEREAGLSESTAARSGPRGRGGSAPRKVKRVGSDR
jgi:hypothetical protein